MKSKRIEQGTSKDKKRNKCQISTNGIVDYLGHSTQLQGKAINSRRILLLEALQHFLFLVEEYILKYIHTLITFPSPPQTVHETA